MNPKITNTRQQTNITNTFALRTQYTAQAREREEGEREGGGGARARERGKPKNSNPTLRTPVR